MDAGERYWAPYTHSALPVLCQYPGDNVWMIDKSSAIRIFACRKRLCGSAELRGEINRGARADVLDIFFEPELCAAVAFVVQALYEGWERAIAAGGM